MAKLDSEKKTPSLASTALDNLPTDALTRRREFVDHLDQLEIDKKEAANDYAAHEKRLSDVFNVSKFVQATVKKLRKMESNVRARDLRQLMFFIKDMQLADPQLNLFNDDGQPGGIERTKEDKTVFDASGNKAAPKASEREPVKKLTGAEPPAHVPTPGIPLDEAKQKFEEAKAKGEERRAAPKHEPEVQAAKSTPKPPVPSEKPAATKAAPPKPPVPASRSAEATAKASERKMSRAPTAAEAKALAKAKADKYFKPKEGAETKPGDGEDDEAPGSYQVH